MKGNNGDERLAGKTTTTSALRFGRLDDDDNDIMICKARHDHAATA